MNSFSMDDVNIAALRQAEVAKRTEEFAKAFVSETKLNPSECEMVVEQDLGRMIFSFRKKITPTIPLVINWKKSVITPEEALDILEDAREKLDYVLKALPRQSSSSFIWQHFLATIVENTAMIIFWLKNKN